MDIGFIGLGKLGLPVALAVENKGHTVIGYDVNPRVQKILEEKILPYREVGAQDLLNKTKIQFVSIPEVVKKSQIIFVPIQTPHVEKYEGITRIPDDRVDFDYSFLVSGIKSISDEVEKQGEDKIVIIISTVLPGTVSRDIKPFLSKHVKLCYNPFFIAMGTTINDFMNPEFVLFGVDDENAAKKAEEFYRTIHNRPFVKMAIESAELTKVAYNTFISMKIAYVNTLMEICHKIPGANVDEVTNALKKATDRVVSAKYLSAGMGDGGGCHPRDNIAMSWLARKLCLSHDLFNDIMKARENQTDWLASLIDNEYVNAGKNQLLPIKILILGKSFKPETNLTVGSPSILLSNLLKEKGYEVSMFDPFLDEGDFKDFIKNDNFYIIFIGTRHDAFEAYSYPNNSIVIDPFRYIPENGICKIIRIGE